MNVFGAVIRRRRLMDTAGGQARRASILVAALTAEEPKHILDRRANVTRMRMEWDERVESLTEIEFIQRYRLDLESFQTLIDKIRDRVEPKHPPPATSGSPISAEIRLSCALRFLCGGAPVDIADMHGIAVSTLHAHLWKTIKAIDEVETLPLMRWLKQLDDDGASMDLQRTAAAYDARTDGVMTGCIGAIDGLAIKVKRPKVNPAHYYCRKGFYSYNMQAICDSSHKFTWVSILTAGATNDGVALSVSKLNGVLSDENHRLARTHYWVSGDDAYKGVAHSTNSLCTPFAGRNVTARQDN